MIKQCSNDDNISWTLKDETGSPWPGFVFRLNKTDYYEIVSNSTASSEKIANHALEQNLNVKIRRESGILYIKYNDEEEVQLVNYSTLKKKFYAPLTIGASLNGLLAPQRYFRGTLSNIRIEVFDE